MNKKLDDNPPHADRLRDNKNRPTIVHPTLPGAVGSMESPYCDGRDTVQEANLILDDTIKNIRGTS
jgi:hypothetical protein